MRHSRVIRKAVFGDNPLNGMALVVGGEAVGKSGYKVSSISEDNENHVVFGIVRYNIYIQKSVTEEEYLWKSFERVPVSLEYFLPNQTEEVIAVSY